MLFSSAAKIYQDKAVGIILSGMGKDGSQGIYNMKKEYAFTIGQNEETSVVFGMNKVAYDLGALDIILNPKGIAETIVKFDR